MKVTLLNENSSLKDIGKRIRKRMHNDDDALILVTGRTGCGKSTFAIQLAHYIDPNFDIETGVVYHTDKIIKQLRDRPRYSATIIDEAIRTTFSREWYSQMNISLIKYFNVSRKGNKTVILTVPNLKSIDSGLRNERAGWWFHIPEKGEAILFVNDFLPFSGGGFYIDENNKLFKNCRGSAYIKNKKQRLALFQKSTGFAGVFSFERLPEDVFSRYKHLAEEANKDIEDFVAGSARLLQFRRAFGYLAFEVKKKYNLKPKEIGEICGGIITDRTIWNLIAEAKKELKS